MPPSRRRLPIVRLGNPILRKRSRPISPAELARKDTQILIERMLATMMRADGVGLAAPQVGVGIRLFVWGDEPDIPRRVVINPSLTPLSTGNRRGLGRLPFSPRAPWARATGPRRAAHRSRSGRPGAGSEGRRLRSAGGSARTRPSGRRSVHRSDGADDGSLLARVRRGAGGRGWRVSGSWSGRVDTAAIAGTRCARTTENGWTVSFRRASWRSVRVGRRRERLRSGAPRGRR